MRTYLIYAALFASLLCAQPRTDQGPVDASFPIRSITLLLKPTQQQQQALDQLLAAQQDRSSPDYHRWLSPEQYADRFGVTAARMARIRIWLEAQGFHVTYTARARNWIAFDATAGKLAQAFHAEIHRYLAEGRPHFANATPAQIPAALSDVAAGLRGLDDFHPQPFHHHVRPSYTTYGMHYLAPGDIATIYDLTPLYNTGVTGAGQSLVVVGQTDIHSSDLASFVSVFSLSSAPPQLVLYGPDPGFPSAADLNEADLDLEWSGAIAPNASIMYVYSTDVFTSVQYAIDQNLAPVISMSYGGCEQQNSGSLASERLLAQQANSHGITWVVASGDSGAAGCDADGSTVATQGLAVEFPASIPEVTAVGGTEFNEGSGSYWSTSNNANQSSALAYIPEIAWNDIAASGALWAGGGGVSSYYPTPAWQTGLGFPNDGHRDVPDLALTASADHDGYVVCTQGSCPGPTVSLGYSVFGGTSAPTPVFAAMVALLNQYLVSTGVQAQPGLGNINPTLYALAQSAPVAFHDITSGSNIVPCQTGTPDCSTGAFGYSAGAGYDQVTGLGSVDAYNLFTSWAPTGTSIQVSATLNGIAWSGTLSYQLAGPTALSGSSVPATFANAPAGSYTVAYLSGGPAGATLTGVTPSVTQTLATNGAIAFVLNFITQTPVTLAGDIMSKFVPTLGACAATPAAAGFLSTDIEAVVWFQVNNAIAGQQAIVNWYTPTGALYRSYAWPGVSNSGSVCLSDSIKIAGNPPASQPGTWSVTVYWTDSPLFTLTFAITVPPPSPALLFVPVTPCRLVDTRSAGPALNADSRDFPIGGSCGVPANAQAYALNVTAVPHGPLGYLTIWPTGQPRPVASTLNSLNGIVKANAAMVPAGNNGSVSVYATGATDVVLDIDGYFIAAGGLAFYPLPPCRIVDTRDPPDALGGPILAAAQTRTFPLLSGACYIPASAQAYSLNFTVVPTGALGYMAAWPTGQSKPVVSTLNAPTGLTTANAAIVPAGAAGDIDVFTTAQTHVVIDVNGYFAPPGSGGLSFYPVPPCRVLDTRSPDGPLGGPLLSGARTFPVLGACYLPSSAQAYSFNATVVPLATLGYLSLWTTGYPQPVVSTLNSPDASIDSNAAIIMAGTDGSINAFSSAGTQLILDTNGYFAP